MSSQETSALPIACNLHAIDQAQRAHHSALTQLLFSEQLQDMQELENGYAFRFAAEHYPQVAAFVANERLCCPFLTFALELPPGQAPIWLRLSGTAEAKAFVLAEFSGAYTVVPNDLADS